MKKALYVALNEYKNVQHLSGCVNDVEGLLPILEKKGYPVGGNYAHFLYDKRATARNILLRLRKLSEECVPGDKILYIHTGHGSSVVNRGYDFEIDGEDELVIPYDFSWENESTWITDDIITDISEDIQNRGGEFITYFDTCHSGTMIDRNLTSSIRFVFPPLDLLKRLLGFQRKPTEGRFRDTKGISLCASREDQTSADAFLQGKFHGAFSFFVTKVLTKTPDICYNTLCSKVTDELRRNGFKQEPVFSMPEEHRNRKVFE